MDDARSKQQNNDALALRKGRAATILTQGDKGTATSGKQLLGS
jgi:hypothetical protein